MINSPVEIKGSHFTLSVIYLYDMDPERVKQALCEKLRTAPSFWQKNSPIVLNIENLPEQSDWYALMLAVKAAGCLVVGITGCRSEVLRHELRKLGLPILTEGRGRIKKTNTVLHKVEEKSITEKNKHRHDQQSSIALTRKPMIVDTPIRSGQCIQVNHADLIVTSHVSSGAELIADGNIHIYGVMRGRALAGASGDKSCQIYCMQLEAELVSIANKYWLRDEIPAHLLKASVKIYLNDGQLAINKLI